MKRIFFLCLFIIGSQLCSGQFSAQGLFNFLQKKYDSSIIYRPGSNWDWFHNYFILSKKGYTITALAYRRPYSLLRRVLNKDSLMQIHNEDSIFIYSAIDSNKFLVVVNIDPVKLDSIWNFLIAQNIYTIRDDRDFGEGCFKINGKRECYIFDGGYYDFYLLANNNLRTIHYYSPSFFETRCCPGVVERKIILQVISLLNPLTYY